VSIVRTSSRLSTPAFLAVLSVGVGYGIVTRPVAATGFLVTVLAAAAILLSSAPASNLVATGFSAAAVVTGSSIGGRFSEVGAGTADLASPKLIPFLIMGLGLALLLPRAGASFLSIPFYARMVVLYLGSSFIGTLQSPSPLLAMAAWLQAAIPVAAAIVLGRSARLEGRPGSILLSATLVAAAFQVLSALFLMAIGYGTVTLASNLERLGGTVHPVALSFQGAVLVGWGYQEILWRSNKTLGRLLIIAAVVGTGAIAIVLARGRTGFVAAIAMIVVIALARDLSAATTRSTRARGALTLLILGALATAYFATASLWFERNDPQALRTLTGRTQIWENHLQLITERPLFGWGPGHLGASEATAFAQLGVTGLGRNAHNALLQAAHDGGTVGAFFWVIGLISLGFYLRQPGSTSSERRRPYSLALYVAIIVLSITEGGPAGFEFSWFLLSAIIAETISSRGASPMQTSSARVQASVRYA
jgi:O-antigen ligase